jgi:hypothetical protein
MKYILNRKLFELFELFDKKVRNYLLFDKFLNPCKGRPCLFETLPPRGFRVDSDLNLSPPSWLESWYNVLRRALAPCRGPAPLVVRSQHTYVLPGSTMRV